MQIQQQRQACGRDVGEEATPVVQVDAWSAVVVLRVDDVDAKATELEALGAKRIDVGQPADADFIPMADPEGNEFCVATGPGDER